MLMEVFTFLRVAMRRRASYGTLLVTDFSGRSEIRFSASGLLTSCAVYRSRPVRSYVEQLKAATGTSAIISVCRMKPESASEMFSNHLTPASVRSDRLAQRR
ncbi:hypothetical protein OUZ56_023056 [Daphnia magna]|uniref:Uncharacterized protein n=1 Tax=Daphnia magna TaxID=35525 RepID=A0ABR0AY88_9CRUS|nr:hypothetical protein OUZ56_023056 [Daphnia magna]